jgi:hypothetical protein
MEPDTPDPQLLIDVNEFVRITCDSLIRLEQRVIALEKASAEMQQISVDLAQVRKIAESLLLRRPPKQPPGSAPFN